MLIASLLNCNNHFRTCLLAAWFTPLLFFTFPEEKTLCATSGTAAASRQLSGLFSGPCLSLQPCFLLLAPPFQALALETACFVDDEVSSLHIPRSCPLITEYLPSSSRTQLPCVSLGSPSRHSLSLPPSHQPVSNLTQRDGEECGQWFKPLLYQLGAV